jgi:glucose-6-phosphate isomerase
MFISYFDDKRVTEKVLSTNINKLKSYRSKIEESDNNNDFTVPESSLYYCKDFSLHEQIENIKKQFKGIKHLVVIGIGGSSLGLEAVHSVLDKGEVRLSILDTVSAHAIEQVISEVSTLKKVTQIVVCVISKSGNTTETLTNSSVFLDALNEKFGEGIYKQTIFIGNEKSDLMTFGKKKDVLRVFMPEVIGGRYSMATAVGLVPMALLGHDVDDFIAGYVDASLQQYESLVSESASRLSIYLNLKYCHYNFFAFEPRLEKLGRWYRQLFAESLGKETDKSGKSVKNSMVPTISTPVELHSVGQLYMSGVPDTLTDFVTFDDEIVDVKISRSNKIAKGLSGFTMQEIATALYGGVIGAYQERSLPYRATIFEEALPYSLGLFMAMRMREVMYVAFLQNLNAFDQPNVELYKIKTKSILSL